MTGLDKIIAQINLDADNTASSVLEKSQAQCEKIIAEAEVKAESIRKTGDIQAQKKYEDIISRANSAAELEERKILLSVKQEIIASMISSTLESIKALPEDKYFELIYKMISKYSENRDGVICLGKADLKRLPADFSEKVSKASKGSLTLSDTEAQIKSGFVLAYGGVDVNCSFESLFSDNSEKISDYVANLLWVN
ncbi:MAG: V-type ATP synthase subunit E [Clostridia bacterium]|nr:V-type ATP synthase subunit E [Clostridia bacterium]